MSAKRKVIKRIQLGNLVPARKNFDNPQEGRVYCILGLGPTIRAGNPVCLICYMEEDKIM